MEECGNGHVYILAIMKKRPASNKCCGTIRCRAIIMVDQWEYRIRWKTREIANFKKCACPRSVFYTSGGKFWYGTSGAKIRGFGPLQAFKLKILKMYVPCCFRETGGRKKKLPLPLFSLHSIYKCEIYIRTSSAH